MTSPAAKTLLNSVKPRDTVLVAARLGRILAPDDKAPVKDLTSALCALEAPGRAAAQKQA